MGAGVSKYGKGKLSFNFDGVVKRRAKKSKRFELEIVYMSRAEVEDILSESTQKTGSYIMYEDLEKQKMYLALKRTNGEVSHHFIHCYNDLYYFDDFPFPYLESIVLYYTKHKFRDTKFTQQAFINPYLSTGHKSVRRQLPSVRRHSSSTTTSTSTSCKFQQISSFRKVDPEEGASWNMKPIVEDEPTRRKNFAVSTPNIVYASAMYMNAEYEPSDSTMTRDSQASDRVTIDSDSGYAVSVMNFKSGTRVVKERRRTRGRITQSFRMLTDSGCRNYYPDQQPEESDDDTQSYTTKL